MVGRVGGATRGDAVGFLGYIHEFAMNNIPVYLISLIRVCPSQACIQVLGAGPGDLLRSLRGPGAEQSRPKIPKIGGVSAPTAANYEDVIRRAGMLKMEFWYPNLNFPAPFLAYKCKLLTFLYTPYLVIFSTFQLHSTNI